MDNSLSKIKQPQPNVNGSEKKEYKIIQGAKTGVVNAPKVSRTPVRDMVEIKRKENPRVTYKFKNNKSRQNGMNIMAVIGVILCGIASLVKLVHK